MRELSQEDIDWAYSACARSWHNPLWCLTHSSRFRERVQRCDDWQDFQLSVEAVIDRLKEQQR